MKTLTITDTRKQIYSLAEDIALNDTQYIVTEHGEPKLVIMSIDEFESWKETLEVMSLYPNLLQDAKDARDEYHRGKTVSVEDLEKEIYEKISGTSKLKSSKKSKKITKKNSKKNSF